LSLNDSLEHPGNRGEVQHHRLVGCVAPVRVFQRWQDAFGLDEDACGVYQVSFGISEVGFGVSKVFLQTA